MEDVIGCDSAVLREMHGGIETTYYCTIRRWACVLVLAMDEYYMVNMKSEEGATRHLPDSSFFYVTILGGLLRRNLGSKQTSGSP